MKVAEAATSFGGKWCIGNGRLRGNRIWVSLIRSFLCLDQKRQLELTYEVTLTFPPGAMEA